MTTPLLQTCNHSTQAESPSFGRRLRACVAIVTASAAVGFVPFAMAADPAPAKLTAAQIVDKFVAARGGLGAWHGVQTMAWTGKMEAGTGDSQQRSAKYAHTATGKKSDNVAAAQASDAKPAEAKQVELPFVLEMKRPGASRLELEFNGKTAVQVYDGKSGWKMRPFLNRTDWEPFSADELKSSAGKWDVDGPLLDAVAQGTKVELEGTDKIDGNNAYRLKLTRKDGSVQHVWIDAISFLDVRVEGTPRLMDGKMHKVYVTQRDFRAEQGLQVPRVLETSVEGYPETHKMVIEKVSLNPVLEDKLFTKPSGT
jgi:outer membrane lipoprotein-sorting protein